MRIVITIGLINIASGASAHPGHIGEIATDPLAAGAIIGAIILIGLAGIRKGKKAKS